MDQVSGCNFMDIVSAGQILAISTEGDGMQRGIKSGPVPAGDRDHRVPGGDVPDSYFPTTGSSRVFSARAENKRTQRGAWERFVRYRSITEDLRVSDPVRADFPYMGAAFAHRCQVATIGTESHRLHHWVSVRFYRRSEGLAVSRIPNLSDPTTACSRQERAVGTERDGADTVIHLARLQREDWLASDRLPDTRCAIPACRGQVRSVRTERDTPHGALMLDRAADGTRKQGHSLAKHLVRLPGGVSLEGFHREQYAALQKIRALASYYFRLCSQLAGKSNVRL